MWTRAVVTRRESTLPDKTVPWTLGCLKFLHRVLCHLNKKNPASNIYKGILKFTIDYIAREIPRSN